MYENPKYQIKYQNSIEIALQRMYAFETRGTSYMDTVNE